MNNRKFRMYKRAWLFISGLFFIYGCAGIPIINNEPIQAVLERTPDVIQPDWTYKNRSYWIEDSSIYCSGFTDNSADIKASLTEAENSARTKLIQRIKAMVLSELKKAIDYQDMDSNTENYLNNIIPKIMMTFRVIGINKKDTYSEKISEKKGKEDKIYFKSYVLAAVSNKDYYKNILSAITSLKNEVKSDKSALKAVGNMEKGLKKDFER